MFDGILDKKHSPTAFLLTSDFVFLIAHAMAQQLEHRGMSTSQIVFLRFVRIWSLPLRFLKVTRSCSAA
jgi:hypothetical protein